MRIRIHGQLEPQHAESLASEFSETSEEITYGAFIGIKALLKALKVPEHLTTDFLNRFKRRLPINQAQPS